jgi:hypothetical protein
MTDIEHASTETMSTSNRVHIRRFATDAVAGLGLFGLAATLTCSSTALAATLALSDTNTSGLIETQPSAHPVVLLALVFSLLFAFNAAFFRHLSRTYNRNGRK